MAGLRASLFGKFMIERDGHLISELQARKVQELLSYLLIFRNHPQPRETLAELLWGNCPPVKSKKYLRHTLWKLQQSLNRFKPKTHAPDLLIEHQWIQINPGVNHWLDIEEFEKTYQAVIQKRVQDLTDSDYGYMLNGIQLYKGDLLEGWYQDWCLFERERFQIMLLMLLDKLVQYCEYHHYYDVGLAFAAEILRHDHAYERAHRHMMRLYNLAGDRTQALRQYARCVNALQEELGVKPSDQTTRLYHQIRKDRFKTPYSNSKKIPGTLKGKQSRLEEVLNRLEDFSDQLSSMQLQVKNQITYIEEVLNPDV